MIYRCRRSQATVKHSIKSKPGKAVSGIRAGYIGIVDVIPDIGMTTRIEIDGGRVDDFNAEV